jgi:threonine synthase
MHYEHEGEFIDEFSRAVLKVYRELLDKYEIEDDDAVITLATGVYVEDEEKTNLVASLMTTAMDPEELNTIIETSIQIYMDTEEGTIEWWLKHFGGSELN